MKKFIWLSSALALLAGSGFVPCRAEDSLALVGTRQTRPASTLGGSQIRSLTRLMSGEGWETTIVLMDLGSTALAFRQSFLGSNGAPVSFHVSLPGGSLTTSSLQGVIGPSGTASFTLSGDAASLQEGWSLLTFDGVQNQLGGYAILRHRAPGGGFSFEATLPLDNMLDSSARIPFDNTGGFQTQLTIVNPASNLAAQVQLTYFDAQGHAILLDSVSLKPGEQTTLTLPNTYPDLANQTGTIAVLANINCLSVTGLRFNPTSGAIASVPVMEFTAAILLQ